MGKSKGVGSITGSSNAVIIEDIVVYPKRDDAAGEFGEFYDGSAKDNYLARLYITIERLIDTAVDRHNRRNVSAGRTFADNKQNTITRLITSEFSFYTKSPLSLQEFEDLIRLIYYKVEILPKNLQFILSSFAVKLPDGIINVVAQLDSGDDPQLTFIVKSKTSHVDPMYLDDEQNEIPMINAKLTKKIDLNIGISVKNQLYPFAFDPISLRKTASGMQYFSCVEICLDHEYTMGRRYLKKRLNVWRHSNQELIPLQCTHVLTSNTLEVAHSQAKHSFIGRLTQADPIHSSQRCRMSMKRHGSSGQYHRSKSDTKGPSQRSCLFGSHYKIRLTTPKACKLLPANLLEKAAKHNLQFETPDTSKAKKNLRRSHRILQILRKKFTPMEISLDLVDEVMALKSKEIKDGRRTQKDSSSILTQYTSNKTKTKNRWSTDSQLSPSSQIDYQSFRSQQSFRAQP